MAGVIVKTLFIAALLIATATGCVSSPASPGAPTSPAGSSLNLSGTWIGTGTDAQGPETFRWTLTQTGSNLTGSASLDPADATDGTCAPRHKQQSRTITAPLA